MGGRLKRARGRLKAASSVLWTDAPFYLRPAGEWEILTVCCAPSAHGIKGETFMSRCRLAIAVAVILGLSACGGGDSTTPPTATAPVVKNAALPNSRPPSTTRPPAVTRPPATTAQTQTTRPSVTMPLAANGCRSESEAVLIAVGTTDRYCFTMALHVNSVLMAGRACTATETGLHLQGTPATASYCIATRSLASFRAPTS